MTLKRSTSGGLYLQLVGRLRDRIASGELTPGDRLPSERELATSLGVSRTTIVNAYRELEAQGLVRGHVGRGTFVCALDESPSGDDAFSWHGKVALGSLRAADTSLRSLVRNTHDSSVINHLSMIKQRTDLCSPSLSQMTVAALIRSGDFDRHLVRLRPELKRRHDVMLNPIAQEWPRGAAQFRRVNGGIFLWGDFGGRIESRLLQTEANKLGVTFVTGETFYPDSNGRGEFRLCFSGQLPLAVTKASADSGRRFARKWKRIKLCRRGSPSSNPSRD